jgi:glutamate---cysteine ligase / carboxylate-amine ligase
MTHDYTIGMEEEYFLVDIETKTAATAMPEAFFEAVKAELGSQVMGEMLQSQIEVVTTPHVDMARAAAELKYLRQTVAAIAARHGLAILASGTHPTAEWGMSLQTQKERYDTVMHDLGIVGRRNMLCGLHVHVELPDPDDRIDVMYRMLPYLPLFVALSTSSPFWQSHRTGLKGYRLAAYNELPRTGVPELFRTREEFDAYVQALVRAGVIEDSSYIWWAIRPSLGHPTLELRAPDCCTLIDDSIAIAALYRCLARRLTCSPWLNADMTPVMRALVVENKWRAQRYGVHGTFVNETGTGAITVAEMLNQVVEDVTPDAEALGCLAEVMRCRAIVSAGTSADAQLAIFDAHIFDARNDSKRHEGALNAVTDWIAAATLQQN